MDLPTDRLDLRCATPVGAVVLAAGGSRRLGQPKQLVRTADGRTLVRNAVEAALDAGCRPVVVVVGAHADAVRDEVASVPRENVQVVACARWREGLSASLRAGIEAQQDAAERPAAVVLLPCDQPALDAAVLRRLIDAWDGSPDGRVGSGYAGTIGTPALFGRARWPDLLALRGDRGARSLLAGAPAVDWPEGAHDVDEPRDL